MVTEMPDTDDSEDFKLFSSPVVFERSSTSADNAQEIPFSRNVFSDLIEPLVTEVW